MKNKNSAAVELGKRGGLATKKVKGIGYFRDLAFKRWAKKQPVDNSAVDTT